MNNIFGRIPAPAALSKVSANSDTFLGKLISMGVKLMVVGAGLYALINLILAGYSFISAGEDPKKVAAAWAQIWQTMLGLAVTAGAFVLAAIIGKLLFNDFSILLQPTIPDF